MGFIRNFIDRAVGSVEEDADLHESHQRESDDPERAAERVDLDALWLELSDDMRQRAVEIILAEVPPETMDDLVKRCFVDGEDWYIEHHFFWGMSIRNLLRREGLTDVLLPSGNWDDYYGCALNEAIWQYAEAPLRKEREELQRMFDEAVGRGAAGPA